MARELTVAEDASTRSVPLLYSLIYGFQKEKAVPESESEPGLVFEKQPSKIRKGKKRIG